MWIVMVAAALAGVPMEEVRWDIAVRGPVAEAIVSQRFTGPNEPGQRAQFTFALPHDGVVDDMTMVIGDTIIDSAIRESRQARQEFEVAAREGQIAGLTTQISGGVFRQELANLPVGQDIEVQLRVLWPVTRSGGEYELVVPTDVAPRFVTGDPHTVFAGQQPYPVRIDADIEAGFDIASLHSPTHRGAAITLRGSHAGVSWQDHHASGDLILRWENNTGDTQAAAITSGDHSLVVMEGPAPTRTDIGAVEWVIVLDTSGSMSGTPWRRAMGMADEILQHVQTEDTVGLITFGDSIRSLEPHPGHVGVSSVRDHLEQVGPSGGTRLPSALRAAVALPHDAAMRRVMVLLTDGLVTDEDGSLTALASAGQRADLTIVGVNASPNRALLDRLAVDANGTSAYFLPGDTAESVSDRVLTALTNAKCIDVRVQWSTGVQAWPNEPGPLMPGRPMVIAAQHREPPRWVEISCHLNGERWSRRVTPTQVDRGRGLQAAWARRNLEALLHDGWATGTDPRLKATALAQEYGILSPWTSLVAVESRPDGDGGYTLAAVDAPAQGTNKPASVSANSVQQVEHQNGRLDTSSTSRAQALTRDFLSQIPAGRGYQSSVGMTACSIGASNESNYPLDGINITDPVSSTTIQAFDDWSPSPTDAPPSISPSLLPKGPNGTNSVVADLGGAGGTADQHEAHGIVGGPFVKDHLWMLAQIHHRNWDTVQAQQGTLRLTLQQTRSHNVTVDADIQRIETSALRLDRRDLHGTWQWFPTHGVQVITRADTSTLRLGSRVRRSAVATSELHIARSVWESGAHVQLGQILLKGGPKTWFGRTESFGRVNIQDQWVFDGAAGVVASGSLAATGRLALRGSNRGGTLLGSVVAEQTVPELTEQPGDVSSLPIQRRLYGTVEVALNIDIWLGIRGQLDDTTSTVAGLDGLAAIDSGRLLHSRGPSAELWITKIDRLRWDAKISWQLSDRTAMNNALADPNIADAQAFINGLRPHRVIGTFGWAIPDHPWTTKVRINGEWASAIQGTDDRWAAPRLSLGLGVEQDFDIRRGTLILHAGVRHGVATRLDALTTPVGPTIQHSRLSERLRDETHVQFGLTWRT